MTSKAELQTTLKDRYGINKNISQTLTKEQCEQLLLVLETEPSAVRLVESFAEKNESLGRNNAYYGRIRSQAENQLQTLQIKYAQLEESLENSSDFSSEREQQLEQQNRELERKVRELTQVNDELKRDNKMLKNISDALRLRTLKDMKGMLRLEDGELRKALMKWIARNFE